MKFKITGKIILSIAFFTFYTALHANVSLGIIIDQDTRQLIAPEGNNYQWTLNGKAIDSQQQNIDVTESGTYQVQYTNNEGTTTSKTISVSVTAAAIRKIRVIGDSTVQTYNSSVYPMAGWGQVLQLFFDKTQVEVVNYAIGGRSSRKFIEEGRWDAVKADLQPDEFVFIQWGHNDRDYSHEDRFTPVPDYKVYLKQYVNETRALGAIPVLISPMTMNGRNVFTESGTDYRGAMEEVADSLEVLFIDLNAKSWEFNKEVGSDYASYFVHNGLDPGEYPNYPDGSTDMWTHFQEMGALNMANFIVEGINELSDDPDMAYLMNAETPTATVSTDITSPDAGYVSLGGTFPIGSPITLKTRLNKDRSFDHWEDENGNTLPDPNLTKFTLTESVYYKAVVTDCAGILGGEAAIDLCGFCSGGTTGIVPCEIKFQCENACSFTGKKRNKYIAGEARTVVSTDDFTDSIAIYHSIDATSAGSYGFTLVYNSKTAGEKLNVFVNGTEVVSGIETEQTSAWNSVSFEVNLLAGTNAIVIESTASEGGILFDFLAGNSTDLSNGACVVVGVEGIAKDNTNAYPNPFNDEIHIQTEGAFTYEIYTISGSMVLMGNAVDDCNVGTDLAKGMYLLHINDRDGKHVQLISKD